jgi:predicted phosphodiesterase
MRTNRHPVVILALILMLAGQSVFCQAAQSSSAEPDVKLPLKANSIRFAVIGDSGTGAREQYAIAEQMENFRQKVKFDFVIMLGDNIYGGHSPRDFENKFERPYKPLLDAGVKFYASLGNHDDPDVERLYKPFNMGGERYYVYKKGDIAFFVLDSNYMDPKQLDWLTQNLRNSQAKWKIAYFHHPLYNEGKSHGPDVDLRSQVAPLFRQYGVNAVFSGHEHVYERFKPIDNIAYFVLGNSGKLMSHDLRQSAEVVTGYDTGRSFMLVEIAGDDLFFQVISATGSTIDSGVVHRPAAAAVAATQ